MLGKITGMFDNVWFGRYYLGTKQSLEKRKDNSDVFAEVDFGKPWLFTLIFYC